MLQQTEQPRKAAPLFDGPNITNDDRARLGRQLDRVRDLMSDGHWRTLPTIAAAVGGSESGCSARVRDLRKQKCGGHRVERRRRGDRRRGLFEYRLVPGSGSV